MSSDGKTTLSVRQRWGTVAPTEQAAADERVALPHSLLLQVRVQLRLMGKSLVLLVCGHKLMN